MSDPAVSTPNTDSQPKRLGLRRIIKSLSATLVLLVVAAGVSSFYWSYPFAWPLGFWSGQSSPFEDRLSALEARVESEWSNGAVGARIDQAVEKALTELSSQQSQQRLESEGAIKQEIETISAQMAQLKSEIDEVSGQFSDRESEDQAQATRLQQFSDRLDRFQATLEAMSVEVKTAQSAVESGLGRPVTEAEVQDFIAQRVELIGAYWAVREIQDQISQGSKTSALASFSALLGQWRQSTNSVLNSLVPLMTQQQAALNDWAPIQWNPWQGMIQGWLGEINGWQLKGAETTADHQASLGQSASQQNHPGWRARVTELFSRVVEVRPRDLAELSQREQRLARANIEQRLLLLQMAVASENVDGIHAQAAQLGSEIERLFDPNDTQSVREGLQTLANIEDSPPPEPLKAVQQTIEQALAQP